MTAPGSKIRISSDLPWRILLKGELTYEDAPEIRRHAEALLESGIAPLRVDVSDLRFLDSSGLSALIYAAQLAGRSEGRVLLIGAKGQLLRTLRVTHLESLFLYEDSPEESAEESSDEAHPPPVEIKMELPGEPSILAVARDRVATALRNRKISKAMRDDIYLALGEALANAIRHGCPLAPPGSKIDLRVRCDQERLIMEVTDKGPGFDPASIPEPDINILRDGGMGVFFMRSVMDSVEYRLDETGNTVVMVKKLKEEPDD